MLPVKSFRQTPSFCGPASLHMVFDYYGIKATEKELAKKALTTSKLGTTAKNMLGAARLYGFKTSLKDRASFQDIKTNLDKKIPVIVDWFSTDEGHYSVVVGLDKKNIYLQDPELGHLRTMDRTTFFRVWFDFDTEFIKTKNDLILRRMIVIYK
jgi:predicted double-glycine peptidase